VSQKKSQIHIQQNANMLSTNVILIHKKYFLILSTTTNGNVTKISTEKAHTNNPLNEINTLTHTTKE